MRTIGNDEKGHPLWVSFFLMQILTINDKIKGNEHRLRKVFIFISYVFNSFMAGGENIMAARNKNNKRHTDVKQKIESTEQKEAFEIYYALGTERSYRKAADMINKSVGTVYKWAKDWEWTSKVQERDQAVEDVMKKESVRTMADIRKAQAEMLTKAMETFWERVEKGKMRIESWSDYERVWTLRKELSGETEQKEKSRIESIMDAIQLGVDMIKAEDKQADTNQDDEK